jgi:MFS transporter, DHA2 family, multidrug resistance protein
LAYREARVQTFADAFLAMAVCLAVATLMVPLLRKIATPAAPSTDAH